MQYKILIISGKQGSGKTTLQQAVTEQWFKNFRSTPRCLNFADPIRKMADAVNFILRDYGWPDRKMEKDGPLMQLLGTEWARTEIDDEIWIKLLSMRIAKDIRLAKEFPTDADNNRLFIIGDCRFLNEFEAFPDALRVRLECPHEVRRKRCSSWREGTNHLSEIGLDDVSSAGEFDMYFNTEKETIAGCVSRLMVALEKGDWMSRRTP